MGARQAYETLFRAVRVAKGFTMADLDHELSIPEQCAFSAFVKRAFGRWEDMPLLARAGMRLRWANYRHMTRGVP